MGSRFAFGPGSIDTKVSIWLNQHEKFSFNCCGTAPWVGLPAWLCLWLRILFLFGRAEPKIILFFFFSYSLCGTLTNMREQLTSSVETALLYNRENGNINGIFILSSASWILSCLSIVPFFLQCLAAGAGALSYTAQAKRATLLSAAVSDTVNSNLNNSMIL